MRALTEANGVKQGEKRETTGCGEGAAENDESGTAAHRDGQFLELLRM